MLENNAITRNTQVQAELRAREVQSLSGKYFDLREFDTGQVLLRVLAESELNSEYEFDSEAQETFQGPPTPVVATFSFHHSRSDRYHECAGGSTGGAPGGLMAIDRTTQNFIRQIEEPMLSKARQWANPIETFFGIIGTAAGHGNMHPLALLSPGLWLDLVKYHTIGCGYICYNLEKGARAAHAGGQPISKSKIAAGYDGFVARVSVSRYSDDSPRRATSIKIAIFNPAKFRDAPSVQLPVGTMPSLENTFFEICRSREGSDIKTRFYSRFYADDKQWEGRSELGREDEEGTYYVRVDPLVARHLLSLADLPIRESDCGHSLPSLGCSYTYGSSRKSYDGASHEIAELHKEAADFLNDRSGWVSVKSDSTVGKALNESPAGGVMRIYWKGDKEVVAVKPVPEILKKQVKAAILFGGDQSPWSRLFGGATSFDLGLLPEGARFVYLAPEET